VESFGLHGPGPKPPIACRPGSCLPRVLCSRLIQTAVHHMPEAYNRPEPSLLPIERPRCPRCHGRMMLARIEPGAAAGSDLRTFECPKCEHVIRGHPMKASRHHW